MGECPDPVEGVPAGFSRGMLEEAEADSGRPEPLVPS